MNFVEIDTLPIYDLYTEFLRLLDEKNLSHGVEVVVNRNGTLFRMGVRPGHILSEINDTKILSTSELSNFENENIYQITFIDENGEKERLIFE